MDNEELSPMPTPYTEDPQLVPGGVDAVEEDPADNGLGRDLTPDANPAVDDAMPEEISEADDKQQEPDGAQDEVADQGSDSESPDSGQEAEDGSPEPPA